MKKIMGCLFLFAAIAFAQSSFAQIQVKALNINSSAEARESRDQNVSHYFGNVNVNTSSFVSWVITNSGDEAIQLLGANLSGIMYSGSTNCGNVLEPKSKCQVDIRYAPFTEGMHTGYLDMVFDKGGNIYFDFWGQGVRWP